MRKQDRNNSVLQGRPSWLRAIQKVPGGIPLMVFFLLTMTAAGVFFAAAGVFCLRKGDALFARCCLLFAVGLVTVEALGLLAALWQERFPRFYHFMWGSGKGCRGGKRLKG